MFRFLLLLAGVLIYISPLHAAEQRLALTLGESTIPIRIIEYGSGPTFVALHANESTAEQVAKAYVERCQGRFVGIENGNERNVSFVLAGVTYTFDPNRIFTMHGIAATLKRYGPYSDAARDEVAGFAGMLLGIMRQSHLIVALHNNTNGSYGINSYLAGGSEAASAQAVHVETGQDADNFFFVTDRLLHAALVGRKYNSVLQTRSPIDDGSLLVYAGQNHWPYVNVEAEHGAAGAQGRMFDSLFGALDICGY